MEKARGRGKITIYSSSRRTISPFDVRDRYFLLEVQIQNDDDHRYFVTISSRANSSLCTVRFVVNLGHQGKDSRYLAATKLNEMA